MSDAPIKDRLAADIKAAMKSGDRRRLATLRNIHAAIKQREVDERSDLDSTAIIEVLDRRAKQHRESLEHYRGAGRDDLAETEEYELAVVAEYLPQPLDEAELDRLIEDAIKACGATSKKDMGKVMGVLKSQVKGRADMAAVSSKVRDCLGD